MATAFEVIGGSRDPGRLTDRTRSGGTSRRARCCRSATTCPERVPSARRPSASARSRTPGGCGLRRPYRPAVRVGDPRRWCPRPRPGADRQRVLRRVGDDWWNTEGPLRALRDESARTGYRPRPQGASPGPGRRHHRVVDLGCGGGLVAEELASRGYRVTGIDLSPGTVREPPAGTRRRPASEVTYQVGSAYGTGAAGGAAPDAVVASDVLEHFHDLPAAALAEIDRLLRLPRRRAAVRHGETGRCAAICCSSSSPKLLPGSSSPRHAQLEDAHPAHRAARAARLGRTAARRHPRARPPPGHAAAAARPAAPPPPGRVHPTGDVSATFASARRQTKHHVKDRTTMVSIRSASVAGTEVKAEPDAVRALLLDVVGCGLLMPGVESLTAEDGGVYHYVLTTISNGASAALPTTAPASTPPTRPGSAGSRSARTASVPGASSAPVPAPSPAPPSWRSTRGPRPTSTSPPWCCRWSSRSRGSRRPGHRGLPHRHQERVESGAGAAS